jgi:hypothetical protein
MHILIIKEKLKKKKETPSQTHPKKKKTHVQSNIWAPYDPFKLTCKN